MHVCIKWGHWASALLVGDWGSLKTVFLTTTLIFPIASSSFVTCYLSWTSSLTVQLSALNSNFILSMECLKYLRLCQGFPRELFSIAEIAALWNWHLAFNFEIFGRQYFHKNATVSPNGSWWNISLYYVGGVLQVPAAIEHITSSLIAHTEPAWLTSSRPLSSYALRIAVPGSCSENGRFLNAERAILFCCAA